MSRHFVQHVVLLSMSNNDDYVHSTKVWNALMHDM